VNGSDELLAAAQRMLAAEHAAVWGYTVAGAVASTSADAVAVLDALAAHQRRVTAAEAVVRDRAAEPVVPDAGYQLPEPVTDAASVRRLAVVLESGCAAAYAALVAASTAAVRRSATGWLIDAATRTLLFGGQSSAFPGLEES
jgi:hypothetical protein